MAPSVYFQEPGSGPHFLPEPEFGKIRTIGLTVLLP